MKPYGTEKYGFTEIRIPCLKSYQFCLRNLKVQKYSKNHSPDEQLSIKRKEIINCKLDDFKPFYRMNAENWTVQSGLSKTEMNFTFFKHSLNEKNSNLPSVFTFYIPQSEYFQCSCTFCNIKLSSSLNLAVSI